MKVQKLLREPLVHFLVLGALLFGLHAIVNDPRGEDQDNRIVISDAKVEWMKSAWSKKWRRMPTEQELQRLIESHIREEILYREALSMGLDGDDTIIRRRLALKMEFLAKDIGELIKPTEEDVRQYYESNKERYAEPAMISFSHVYFNADTRNSPAKDARAVLREIQQKNIDASDAWQKGDRFMLHYDYPLKTRIEIMQLFGTSFADTILNITSDSWQGPVESGYGLHLVRVTERIEGRVPGLEEVRGKVFDDLVDHRRKQSYDAYYQKLREKYDIQITSSAFKEEKVEL